MLIGNGCLIPAPPRMASTLLFKHKPGIATFGFWKISNPSLEDPVRTDSTGNYLYVGSCGVNVPNGYGALVGFSINHTTGDLTELPSSPYTYPAIRNNTVLQRFTETP